MSTATTRTTPRTTYIDSYQAARILGVHPTSVPGMFHEGLIVGKQRVKKSPIQYDFNSVVSFAKFRESCGKSANLAEVPKVMEEIRATLSDDTPKNGAIAHAIPKKFAAVRVDDEVDARIQGLAAYMGEDYIETMKFILSVGLERVDEVLLRGTKADR